VTDTALGQLKPRLAAALMEAGKKMSADAVMRSEVQETADSVTFFASKEALLTLRSPEIPKLVAQLMGRPVKVQIETVTAAAPVRNEAPKAASSSEAAERALSHPEVKRFQEAFPGALVRQVEDLSNL
jgi:hypothetical protein